MMTEMDPNTKRRKLVKTRNNETMFVKGFLTVPTKLRKIYDAVVIATGCGAYKKLKIIAVIAIIGKKKEIEIKNIK